MHLLEPRKLRSAQLVLQLWWRVCATASVVLLLSSAVFKYAGKLSVCNSCIYRQLYSTAKCFKINACMHIIML